MKTRRPIAFLPFVLKIEFVPKIALFTKWQLIHTAQKGESNITKTTKKIAIKSHLKKFFKNIAKANPLSFLLYKEVN